jgi:hypothetical protein
MRKSLTYALAAAAVALGIAAGVVGAAVVGADASARQKHQQIIKDGFAGADTDHDGHVDRALAEGGAGKVQMQDFHF